MQLYDKTVKLLRERPVTKPLRVVAAETGLTESFLNSLIVGSSKEPSVNKIETLYNYLSDKPLFNNEQ